MSTTQETDTKTLPEAETVQYRTKDLNQAAFIWCQPGAQLTRLASRSGRGTTVFFVFELPISETDLPQLIFSYANKQTQVEPLEFCSKQNSLRDLLHGGLKRSIDTEDGD